MDMQGEARLPASRQRVWDALNDPQILQACIPGCEAMLATGDGAYTATVVSTVGPIKARFAGKVVLSNVVAPISYTLTGEGSGGAAGFAKARIGVVLDALEPALTLLRYEVQAQVGGKLAQLGSRLIDAVARKQAQEFFERFAALVGDGPDPAAGAPAQQLDLQPALAATAPALAARTTAPAAAERPAQPGLSAQASAQAAAEVMAAEQIKVWIEDGIAVVTLNRPSNRNAMTYAMWKAIPAIFGALERNAEVRAVILTGAGEDFCSGADIPEFETVRADVAQATAYEVAVDACCDAILGICKPTIALARGYCLGGGAHLAMSCDFRYAAEKAVFGIPAARLSIVYGVKGTRKLLSLVGLTNAKRVLFGAQRFNAQEALRIGFADWVAQAPPGPAPSFLNRLMGTVPASSAPAPDPMAEARRFAQSLAENAPLSIGGAKYLLNGMAMGTGALDLVQAEALIAQAAGSHDYREGRSAFAEKRPPKFLAR